jgi:hypothetical protein
MKCSWSILRGWIWTLPLIRQAKSVVGLSSTPSHTHIATRTSCAISKMFKNPKKTLTEIVESKSKKDYKDVIFSTAGFLLWMSIIQNLNLRYFI